MTVAQGIAAKDRTFEFDLLIHRHTWFFLKLLGHPAPHHHLVILPSPFYSALKGHDLFLFCHQTPSVIGNLALYYAKNLSPKTAFFF